MESSSALGGRAATPSSPLRCAVLISGSGSGMEALVRSQQANNLAHQTVVVLSNKPNVEGLKRAARLQIPTIVVEQSTSQGPLSREEHEFEIMKHLEAHDVEFVVLAGYMLLMSPTILERWGGRMVNIHPSLLPHFPGAHAHRDVLKAQPSMSGCTIHLVDEGMDTGSVLAQASVPLFKDDGEGELSDRVKIEEHRLYPEVLTWIAEGRVRLTKHGLEVDAREDRLVC